MATEMTPQERAAYVYAKLGRGSVPDIKTIYEHTQATRRAALLEAAQRAGLGECNSLLDAPCLWCGYNGSGYYQAGTHDQSCIWHDVGGERERIDRLAQEG